MCNDEIGSRWRPSRLMLAAADERYVDANIFASARNTVRILQASAEDQYPFLPSAVLAVGDRLTSVCNFMQCSVHVRRGRCAGYKLADAFTDASACVCRHIRVVHGCLHKHQQVCAAMCGRGCVPERICVRSRTLSRKRSHPQISAAVPTHMII